jgi:AraC family transcriptional regulator, regulatory protein of adaptative response / methylated-DNA-[protein]-cysteine methyltransferase
MGANTAEMAVLKKIDDVLSPDAAWRSVANRDRAADGKFVFAVRTTGIFCRPSCPAKRPNRDNVEFFLSAEEASASGFRACKRCNPGEAVRTLGEKRVREAAKYIEKHPNENLSLDTLASRVTLSPFHLQREFKKIFGLTPRAYQAALRVGRLKSNLAGGESVSRATYNAGFGSSRAAYETASKTMGMTPGEFRRGGEGKQIRYEIGKSPLGKILVAATEKGLCSVAIGDHASELERDLAKTFPGALITPTNGTDKQMSKWMDLVINIASGKKTASPPLDISGTAFQLKVWDALRQIPAGSTRSYSQVATELGLKGASRAVGSACGKNPVALVIPCHRVLRGDGELGGYRWGVERKEKLLVTERGDARSDSA